MSDTSEKNMPQKKTETATGVVVSAGGDKTCSVAIERLVKHKLYGKFLRRRTKLAVHDPENQAGVGDTVTITPCRPVSKTKRWRLLEVVSKAAM